MRLGRFDGYDNDQTRAVIKALSDLCQEHKCTMAANFVFDNKAAAFIWLWPEDVVPEASCDVLKARHGDNVPRIAWAIDGEKESVRQLHARKAAVAGGAPHSLGDGLTIEFHKGRISLCDSGNEIELNQAQYDALVKCTTAIRPEGDTW